MSEKPKRMGRVCFAFSTVVDLNNKDMVEHAKDALYEDLHYAVKMDELQCFFREVEDPSLKEEDIPSFLTEEDED